MRTRQIDEATLMILSRVTVEGNTVFLTCGQLDRKQYQSVNEILENIGGRWNRKAKGHIFTEDPATKLENVLLTGETVPLKSYGYFPTPPSIARQLIEMAEIGFGMSVLEPSAGQGCIADFIPKDCKLDCIELLDDNVAVLESKGYVVQQGDFLEVEVKPLYDRVIANPPFSYEGHPQSDVDHVTHMMDCLLPSGRLVSVMSSGVLFRGNKKTVIFRDMVEKHGGFFERLPEGSFEESGTNVNACIVVMDN